MLTLLYALLPVLTSGSAPENDFRSSEQTEKLLYKSSMGRRAPESTTQEE